MAEQPETSVVIPVLNGETYVNDAVASVLGQLGAHDEVLVIDDRSTDATRAKLNLSDRRVSLLDGLGTGPASARNIGLSRARGAFIAFLDHDDMWPTGRHAALKGALLDDLTANAACGRLRIRIEEAASPDYYPTLDGLHFPWLPWTCLYRRDLIDRAGFFDETMRYGEDLDYYHRLVEAGMKLVSCNRDSLIYRRHSTNASNFAPAQRKILLDVLARKAARARNSRPGA